MEMTGAQAMYEMMVRLGIRHVFGNPGTTELPLMDLFARRSELTYILALHEDSAVGIAAGYSDAGGDPAVVNLHTNPGLAHGLGNLYNAYRAGVPLIVTAGQQDTRAMIDEPLLFADMLAMARQFCKWAWEARHASEVPAAMARAFKIATTPPTGPVFLSLPVNVMEESADVDLPPVTRVESRIRGDRAALESAAEILLNARNPAIIAGDACARSRAVSSLVTLAELIAARVHSEPLNSLLDFPTSHSLYAGPLFPNAAQTLGMLRGADVILIIGSNTLAPLVYTGVRMIPPEARLIQIDPDERELGKNHPVELAIQADPRCAVDELIEVLGGLIGDDARANLARRREALEEAIARERNRFAAQAVEIKSEDAVPPGLLARELRTATEPDAVLVDEAVTCTAHLRLLFELSRPDSYFYAKAGSLGLGLPAAIGVKLARPANQVVCAVGDGSALYSIQALWTAARYGVGVKFVIFNNASYAILKGGLLAMKGSSVEKGLFVGMDLTDPEIDFVRLSESMGVPARRVNGPASLREAIEWALEGDGPTLLDVSIPRDVRSVLR